MTLVSSWSRVNAFSGSPSQSLHARNFSTIQASSPAGESLSAAPSVCGLVCCSTAYPDSSRRNARQRREVGLLVVAERDRLLGRIRERHVDVDRHAVLGVPGADPGRDLRPPVAALRAVAVVPEAGHQHDERARDARDVPTRRGGRPREPVAGERRDDDVERVGRVAAVTPPDR